MVGPAPVGGKRKSAPRSDGDSDAMKILLTVRLLPLAALAIGCSFATAGCRSGNVDNFNNGSRVAGHSGPGAPSGMPVSGGGGPVHDRATNESHVGPTNAGPAGSQ